jgi:triphosphatase
VLAGATLPELASRFGGAAQPGTLSWDAFLSLQTAVDTLARKRRATAAKMVAASGATRLLLGFCAWVIGERWREGASRDILLKLDAPVCEFAGKALRRKRRRLLRRARHLGRLQGVEQHQVRIAAKKLRYASEFFSSLLSSGKERTFARRLSRLQDELGLRNDARVADGLLAELVGDGGGGIAQAAGFARGCLLERGAHGKRRLMRCWNAFEKAPLPHVAAAK